MRKDRLIEVLADWNPWTQELDEGVPRPDYTTVIDRFSSTGQIVTVVGARRSGKSTLMRQYAKELMERGIKPKNILFVNFEDPRFTGRLSLEFMQEIYETYLQYMAPETPYLFLDEVQNVHGWEKFVRSIHERDVARIVVSGSSSKLLSSEFGTVLSGRHMMVEVFPLSFLEFLRFNAIELKNKVDVISKRHKIRRLLTEYMHYGGFPKVAISNEKTGILLRYFDDIILRDVAGRYNIRNLEKLKTLAQYYITNISSPITFNSIKNFLKMPIDTVERYSYYLSYSWMFFFVKKFSYSIKEQEKNPRKVYCIDSGLRNAVSFRFSEDLGRIAENIVFVELLRRGEEVYYWKDGKGKEVDFIIKRGLKPGQLVQVCWDVDEHKTKEREAGSLLKAMKEFELKEGMIITEDYEGDDEINSLKIVYVPLWKWLLQ